MKKIFFSFWLPLFLGTTTILFNSCSKDDNSQQEVTSISLDKPTLTLAILMVRFTTLALTATIGVVRCALISTTPMPATTYTFWASACGAMVVTTDTVYLFAQ